MHVQWASKCSIRAALYHGVGFKAHGCVSELACATVQARTLALTLCCVQLCVATGPTCRTESVLSQLVTQGWVLKWGLQTAEVFQQVGAPLSVVGHLLKACTVFWPC